MNTNMMSIYLYTVKMTITWLNYQLSHSKTTAQHTMAWWQPG